MYLDKRRLSKSDQFMNIRFKIKLDGKSNLQNNCHEILKMNNIMYNVYDNTLTRHLHTYVLIL